jgi:ABC-type antimicrobial peptide transport system permease subunit
VRDQIGFSYHTWPLEAEGKKKECTYLEVGPGYTGLMGLRLVAGSLPQNPEVAQSSQQKMLLGEVYDRVRAAWARLYPATPLNSYFQDEVSVFTMRLNAIITKIFSGFALISIFMAATGMFALVSLTVLKRLREIAIRKIVGARSRHIFRLVGSGYWHIFLISSVIGCATGFLLSRRLMDMIFRINAGVRPDSLAFSFLGILLLSGTIIASRVLYLTQVKTTDILKTE